MYAHPPYSALFAASVVLAMSLTTASAEIPEEPKTPINRIIKAEDRDKASAAVEAAVPRARKDPTRPVFHFRPPAQWMNDICGAIRYADYYHVFYQYNPFSGDRWGEDYTLWAHARSKDLVHWEDLPWAFLPMKDLGERRCNSGCITLDGHGPPHDLLHLRSGSARRHPTTKTRTLGRGSPG